MKPQGASSTGWLSRWCNELALDVRETQVAGLELAVVVHRKCGAFLESALRFPG
jgi:hypothetical protein